MLLEVVSVRGEQLIGTPEAQRLGWSSVEFPGNRIRLFLSEATQVTYILKQYD